MKCEGCGEDAEVECADCAPKGADAEPLLLCQHCCSRIHIGSGRLSKHRFVSLAYKKQGLELRAKFEKCQLVAGELKNRKAQVHSCKEDIDERVKVYERQIRETTLAVCQKIKQRAITLIKKMKEAANTRAADMDSFDKYLSNTFFSKLVQIRKELQALEKTSVENYQEKVESIEKQIDSLDFTHLREHLPSTCLEYNIDFAGVQQDIKALDFELIDPPLPSKESVEITETPKYLCETLEEGAECKVCIQTAVTRSGEFWLQPDFPTEVYDKLLDISHKTRQEFICNLDWMPYEPEDEALKAGVLCCVLYPSDNKWYRGCVEELRSDRKSATVRYLDFGNTSMHSVSQILPYRCLVPGVAFQAIECRLAGLTEDLSHEAKWTFNDMVRDKLLDCKFINKETEESKSFWLVELNSTQEDSTVLNLNQMVRERVVKKTQKESISCRDVRLFDENLPSSFKVISTTVKSGDPAAPAPVPDAGATADIAAVSTESSAGEEADGEGDTQEESEPKDDQPHGYSSQDIRSVVHKSQDIRNLPAPRSQDARKSSGKSKGGRKHGSSQDVRKSGSTQDSQDGRQPPPPANSGTQEQMDDCSSFLSSIVLEGQTREGRSGGGSPAGISLERIAEGWKHQQVPRKVSPRGSKHSRKAVATDVRIENSLPKMLTVTEVEATSRILTAAPVAITASGEERVGTWIPSGQLYKGVLRPPSGKSATTLVPLNPPPAGSSLEREAQAVVANIIQEVVSHFCVNGKMVGAEEEEEEVDVEEVQPVTRFSEDLAYDLESRGSDEHSTETITPCDETEKPSLDVESEETAVKSLLLDEEPLQSSSLDAKFTTYSKSISGSSEDINVKDSMLKPEIQDKSFSNLCGYDSEETAVKTSATTDSGLDEVCEEDPPEPLSISTNEISQLESLEPASDQWEAGKGERDYSLRPSEDISQTLESSVDGEEHRLFTRLPGIMFVPGSTFDLFVLDGLQENGSFCGQIARTDQEEEIFFKFTEELQKHAVRSQTYPMLKEGALILAPFENLWYRALILKLNQDQTVKVCFVDYGNTETVPLSDLKPVPKHLMYIPHQTTTCRLVSYYQSFTEQERAIFNRITNNQKLQARVISQNYSLPQVSLAVTLGKGEVKDVTAMIVEEAPRIPTERTSAASSVKPVSDQRSHGKRSTEPKVSILSRTVPDRSMSSPPTVRTGVVTYPPIPYIEVAPKPMNCVYYPSDRVVSGQAASPTEYSHRRGVTVETFSPRDPQVLPPSGPQYGYYGDVTNYPPPPRNLSPRPSERSPLLRSPTPSRLREDAAPFHPGSVYISPLKTEESLDMHLRRGRSGRDYGYPGSAGDGGLVKSPLHWPGESQPPASGPMSMSSAPVTFTSAPPSLTSAPESFTSAPVPFTSATVSMTSELVSMTSEPGSMTSEPVSMTSEPPSIKSSSAFDEDAWIEPGSKDWPSTESLTSKPKPTQRREQQSHRQPTNRGYQNKQRNSRQRGNRDYKDGHRSGNNSDSSDRGDRGRSGACYKCYQTGHYVADCPQTGGTLNSGKSSRTSRHGSWKN